MLPADLSPFIADEKRFDMIAAIVERYHGDADFRTRIGRGDHADLFKEFGHPRLDGVDYRFLADTDELVHFVMPPDPNTDLADDQLSQISGGGCASTAGTIGSASTVLTFTSISTVGSASTLGSAGSVG